jgi:hypothetical protein
VTPSSAPPRSTCCTSSTASFAEIITFNTDLVAAFGAPAELPRAGDAMTTAACAVTSGRAPVNGIQLYYEIRGDGDRLVMLRGALYAMEKFGGNLDALARHRRVISVDLRAYGRSSDGVRSPSRRWRTTSRRSSIT